MKPIHYQTTEINKILSCNQNLWLWGPAASGKSQLIVDYAKKNDREIIIITCGPNTDIDDIIGYKNLNNQIIEGSIWNIKPKTIIIFEEIDLLNSKVQNQLNTLLQERVMKITDQHRVLDPSVLICATANTNGLDESALHATRSTSDHSLISRFVKWKLDIDPKILQYNASYIFKDKIIVRQTLINLFNTLNQFISENNINLSFTIRQVAQINKLLALIPPLTIGHQFFENFAEWESCIRNDDVCKAYHEFLNIKWFPMPKFDEENDMKNSTDLESYETEETSKNKDSTLNSNEKRGKEEEDDLLEFLKNIKKG